MTVTINEGPLTDQEIAILEQLARGGAAGADFPGSSKRRFRQLTRKVLVQLAADLGLEKGQYDLRFNPGGVAVTGEHTLQSERIYVHIGFEMGDGHFGWGGVYYRQVESRSAHARSGHNNHLRVRDLANWTKFVDDVRRVMNAPFHPF